MGRFFIALFGATTATQYGLCQRQARITIGGWRATIRSCSVEAAALVDLLHSERPFIGR